RSGTNAARFSTCLSWPCPRFAISEHDDNLRGNEPALPPRKRWRLSCESNGARSDRGLSTSDGSRPPDRRRPHCNHQMNRENGNPFLGHTWSIASFPAPVKNSVI